MIWVLFSCRTDTSVEPKVEDMIVADIFVEHLGDPIPTLRSELIEHYENGSSVMSRGFTPNTGLGPTFNADSCAGCHQMPVAGGSAPRYRDFWLIQEERWDGALVAAGTNGLSPVRNEYATAPIFHIPPSPDATTYARRNTPPMFGVGLFAFVSDQDILDFADPDDADGDGISGRANYEKGEVAKFGYKSQAASLESFNRGAIFNQMGITSDPLFYEFPELEVQGWNWQLSLLNTADAQVSALDEPTVDNDGVPDPEINNEDQRDLLVFSTYIGVPTPTPLSERSKESIKGERQFSEVGCAGCHIPSIPSVIGALPAYTDLLLHDMGEALADGIKVGFAQGNEFRTQPLWGVGLHPPYLHDGRADTLIEAIEWHGGEAEGSIDRWLALTEEEQSGIIDFLGDLGSIPNKQNFLNDTRFSTPIFGDVGGPSRQLSSTEQATFERGLQLFDGNFVEEGGLSPMFNADSCRACHQDPVIGGAGGLDVNILRIGGMDANSVSFNLALPVLMRSTLPFEKPAEILELIDEEWTQESLQTAWSDGSLIIEARQPPSLLGIGAIETISTETILAGADPDDSDEDGISGRVRWLNDGQLGRMGWKAQIATVSDFVADALLQEIGGTIHPSLSDFTIEDDLDTCEDPEFQTEDVTDLTFFVYELAPPKSEPDSESVLFEAVGCAGCHTPTLDSVSLYSDLLLHDMGYDPATVVDHDPGVLPTEFRTAPLWGVNDTAPYMHDGSAETLFEAILHHGGEAERSVAAFANLTSIEQEELILFLEKL